VGTARDADRAEVHERRGVARRRLDRHGLATTRHGPRERDNTFGGRAHVGGARRAEIDAAVLAGGVRVIVVERERS
jgi:hypothetical protein